VTDPLAGGWADEIVWTSGGLLPVIVQDSASKAVLMFAYMNREAFEATVATGEAHYWSRSRKSLWRKGEQSGHFQRVESIRLDCDGDVILLNVIQIGSVACHTGRTSCFFRQLEHGHWRVCDPVLKDPSEIYRQ